VAEATGRLLLELISGSYFVTIQSLAVGRAARAINAQARYPRAGEGARGTHQARI